eukprot:COSAG04_NODE_878_length_9680_cov_2.690951_12_plen_26_part_01
MGPTLSTIFCGEAGADAEGLLVERAR